MLQPWISSRGSFTCRYSCSLACWLIQIKEPQGVARSRSKNVTSGFPVPGEGGGAAAGMCRACALSVQHNKSATLQAPAHTLPFLGGLSQLQTIFQWIEKNPCMALWVARWPDMAMLFFWNSFWKYWVRLLSLRKYHICSMHKKYFFGRIGNKHLY